MGVLRERERERESMEGYEGGKHLHTTKANEAKIVRKTYRRGREDATG